MTSNQVNQLRLQILAYRLLARNQPLTSQLALGVQGKISDLDKTEPGFFFFLFSSFLSKLK